MRNVAPIHNSDIRHMGAYEKKLKPFRLAVAQMPITGDAKINGKVIRGKMHSAAYQNARLIQFPEGALSGYAKNPIMSWDEVNWDDVSSELQNIMDLAKQLDIWVAVGSAHPLTPPNRPHNSLYIISDEGKLVTRYDKRICSYSEVTKFYSSGSETITFEIDGYKFGCLICVEINFPSLVIEYGKLDVDCLLLSSYPIDKVFYTKAQAYAAIHNIWVGLSIPTECIHLMNSGLIGPDGLPTGGVKEDQDIFVASLDASLPQYEIALKYARPWRSEAENDFRKRSPILDQRSIDRSLI